MNPDKFDLEQAIMKCWSVCDDLRSGMNQQVLANYYEAKFDKLWEIFEKVIHEQHCIHCGSTTSKTQK
jgi:hypothetical protein